MGTNATKLLLAAMLIGFLPSTVLLGVTEKKKLSPKTGLISKTLHRKLSRVHSLLETKEYAEAKLILNKLKTRPKIKPFELAQVLQTLGYLYASQENLGGAVSSFNEAIALNALPAAATLRMMYGVAQLQAGMQKYSDSYKSLEKWLSYTENISAEQWSFTAMIAANLGKRAIAVDYIERAIKGSKEPKESWLQLAVALHSEAKKFDRATQLLDQLVLMNPSKESYWSQLAGMQMASTNETKALVTMDLAVKMGHLTAKQSRMVLAQLYALNKVPHKAATVLISSLEQKLFAADAEVLESIGQNLLAARDSAGALNYFQLAVKASQKPSGRLYQTIGQLFVAEELWEQAIKPLRLASKSNDLSAIAKGRAQIALGIAQYRANKPETALKTLLAAEKIPGVADQATAWSAHIKARH